MSMNRELRQIREQVKELAEREATKLYRMARNLQKRGGSVETVAAIREEANQLHMTAYPERLIAWDAAENFKYAFR